MAKTVNCAFCGKELKTGLFTGNAYSIFVGGTEITCCEHCWEAWNVLDKRESKRFDAKVANYMKANRKRRLTEAEAMELYKLYLAEREAYRKRSGQDALTESIGFFQYSEDGCFSVAEFEQGSVISSNDMAKVFDVQEEKAVCAFRSEDISRLEYRKVDKLGTSINFFKTAYLYEVRLNDPAVMTYKPSVTYFVTWGTALLPHKQAKKAEDQLLTCLDLLKKFTGSTVPVRRIK